MHVKLPVTARLPGFKTVVTQTLNVESLKDSQFKRLHNAAKNGYVHGGGYVAEVLTHVAERHYLMGPVVTRTSGYYTYVTHDLFNLNEHVVKELMDMSDVRQKFAEAQSPTTWARRKTGMSTHPKDSVNDGRTVYLVGWYRESLITLRKEILLRMKAIPEFVENNKRLAAIVAEKPVVTIFSHTI